VEIAEKTKGEIDVAWQAGMDFELLADMSVRAAPAERPDAVEL
jgi:hypothetical protein